MDKKTRAIRCVAFHHDRGSGTGGDSTGPSMAEASPALKQVFDGHCPFILHCNCSSRVYYVVCSC